MIYPLTTDDRPDYWTCRSDAGVAALLELETVQPVRIPPDTEDGWEQLTYGEVLRGYRVDGRAVAAAYTTGGEENWATLGITEELNKRIIAHRTAAVVRRAHDAEGIGQRHPWHHCGKRCPRRQPQ